MSYWLVLHDMSTFLLQAYSSVKQVLNAVLLEGAPLVEMLLENNLVSKWFFLFVFFS